MSTSHRSTRPSANGPDQQQPDGRCAGEEHDPADHQWSPGPGRWDEPISQGGPVDVAHRPRVPRPGRRQPSAGARARQRVPARMPERWFRHAVIYCLDVDTFQDSDGDGVGDLPGLIDRLDHLARLGVTCIWLNPIHPSPDRDDGYDITDFYAVHPAARHARRLRRADPPGRQPRHPGHDRPRREPHLRRAPVVPVGAVPTLTSPYRDWYVWSKERAVRPPPGDGVPRLPGHDVDLRRRRPARGTTTASTTSSPTSTWRTRGCGRRSRRSSASGCSSASPASASTPRRSSSS